MGDRRLSSETETTVETDVDIATEGASLPVNPSIVFRRVELLLGQELSVPEIRVLRLEPANRTHALSTDNFSRRMGIVRRQSMNEVGGNTHRGVVRIFYTQAATSSKIEQVLAHEFVHVSQPQRLRKQLAAEQGPHSETTDARIVREAIVEGSAVYVANRYTERYLPNVTKQATYPEWESFSAGTKWHLSPYYVGEEYVRNRIDSADATTSIYAAPPVTTEQLLHGKSPATEPPTNLSVNSNVTESMWEVEQTDVKGELFVRIVLAEQLSASRASAAASGWGNDRVVTFRAENRTLHAWTLKWDDEQNATEFENAVRAYLDRRAIERDGVRTDGTFRVDLRRVDATTVTLLLGNSSVETTSVTVNGPNVSIRPGAVP